MSTQDGAVINLCYLWNLCKLLNSHLDKAATIAINFISNEYTDYFLNHKIKHKKTVEKNVYYNI